MTGKQCAILERNIGKAVAEIRKVLRLSAPDSGLEKDINKELDKITQSLLTWNTKRPNR